MTSDAGSRSTVTIRGALWQRDNTSRSPLIPAQNAEYSMETREELLYNKEKLLSIGDKAEAEIQANLQSDHVSNRWVVYSPQLISVLPISVCVGSVWAGSVGVFLRVCLGDEIGVGGAALGDRMRGSGRCDVKRSLVVCEAERRTSIESCIMRISWHGRYSRCPLRSGQAEGTGICFPANLRLLRQSVL